jgi:S1/P1 Nuclease
LLLLAHYVGDVHQPLHVGAIYLSANGTRVNPDVGVFDATTETRGGNQIMVTALPGARPQNLHANWDAIPASLNATQISAAWIARANAVTPTPADIFKWPAVWATETVKGAEHAFKGLQFTKMSDTLWGVTLPIGYAADAETLKNTQLTEAGARLAQILKAVFP